MSMLNVEFDLKTQSQRKGRRVYRAPSPPINHTYCRLSDREILVAAAGALLAAAVIALYALVLSPDLWW